LKLTRYGGFVDDEVQKARNVPAGTQAQLARRQSRLAASSRIAIDLIPLSVEPQFHKHPRPLCGWRIEVRQHSDDVP
jgi:hypothetical protein